jgi:hypothetical protein
VIKKPQYKGGQGSSMGCSARGKKKKNDACVENMEQEATVVRIQMLLENFCENWGPRKAWGTLASPGMCQKS